MFFLADIGGTNTRLALADLDTQIAQTVQSFENSAYSDFDAVVSRFLTSHPTQNISACAFALAGPVRSRAPRLTNLDWVISADRLEIRLHAPVRLLNDLEALGHALATLAQHDFCPLVQGDAQGNGQRLVVGIGTGMNIGLTQQNEQGRTAVWSCEYGAAPLPASLIVDLRSHGLDSLAFDTTEKLFSGPGLTRCQEAGVTDATYASWVGKLCAVLTLQMQPLSGVFLSGGVARAILGAAPQAFAHAITSNLSPAMRPPVTLVTADDAALRGCLSVLQG